MTRETPARSGRGATGRMVAAARVHRRRWLRQAGLRLDELDAVAISFLDGWARATAADEHGAARLNMADLAERLIALSLDEKVRNRGRTGDDEDDGIDWDALTEDERRHVRETEMILFRRKKAT